MIMPTSSMNLGDHDHVVKIYGFSLQNSENTQYFRSHTRLISISIIFLDVLSIVMEYAQHGHLRSLLRRRALDLDSAYAIAHCLLFAGNLFRSSENRMPSTLYFLERAEEEC